MLMSSQEVAALHHNAHCLDRAQQSAFGAGIIWSRYTNSKEGIPEPCLSGNIRMLLESRKKIFEV